MSHNIEPSSLSADLILLQYDTKHAQISSNILHNKVEADIKETIKTVDLSKEYCSSELLKDGSAKNGADDLLLWGPMLSSKHEKYEPGQQCEPDDTNIQCLNEDLIIFEDDKLIDISREHLIARKSDNILEPKPKYYDDLKTVFETSLINMKPDGSINCTETITLGRVNQLKIDAESISTERINSDKETISLGRISIIKPLKEITETMDTSNLINKTVDMIDLFEDLSVTPEDFCKPTLMTKSHEGTSTPMTLDIEQQNENPILNTINNTRCSKTNLRTNKDVESARTHINPGKKILTVKDDKILDVMGNNIIIKCDRTYVISAAPQAVCCKCKHDTKLKTIHNEVIKVNEQDMPEVISINIATMPATVNNKPKTININNSTSILNLPETKKSPVQIDSKKTDKQIQTLSERSERDMPATSCSEKTLQGLNSTRLLPEFEPEVLEQNHAKTRIRWQKERRAIDEFINKGKVIK